MGKKRTQAYTEEFRREAVKRAEKPGVTTASVARELGVSAQQIYNWRRQFNRLSDKQFNSVDGVDYSKQESAEVRRLRKELHEARQEVEFLKKAAAYFANHQE
ncbi:transposase [Microbulbifer taiwanensis]|uniref:Transposase n=2 Tax=Microbulbifer TaxID=48073 RepID=A0ABW1YNE7_9GAMM|nr:transposase [Microbulbifer taiwanensis]